MSSAVLSSLRRSRPCRIRVTPSAASWSAGPRRRVRREVAPGLGAVEYDGECVAAALEERHAEPLPELLVDLRPGHEGTQHVNDWPLTAEGEAGDEEGAEISRVTALVRARHVQVGLGGQRLEAHVVLGRPPAVDGLLARPGAGRDPVDRQARVATFGGELERRGEDGPPAFLAALTARASRDKLVMHETHVTLNETRRLGSIQ